MKRNLIVVAFIILAGIAGYFYFSNRTGPFLKDTSMYKAVPISSPVFFELNSIRSIPVENEMIQALGNAGIAQPWLKFLHQADSLIEVSEHLPGSLRNRSFLLAFGIAGRNELVPLIISNAGSESRQSVLIQFIETIFPVKNFNWVERDYGKHQITEVTDAKNTEVFFFSIAGDLLLASPRAIIIEQSLRQLSSNGIQKNPYFLEVNKNAGSQAVSLYVNHNWVNSFFAGFLNRKSFEKIDEFGATSRFQYPTETEKFGRYASWSELGFNFRSNQLVLNGSTAADDSLNHFLSVFNDQQPVRVRAGEVLPQNTSFFCSYSVSAKNAFFERLENFFMHSPAYYHREERMKRFDRGFRANTRNIFQEMVKDEVIVAATTIPVIPANKTTYFILQTNSRSNAEKQFQQIMANFAVRNNTETEEISSEFVADNGISYQIFRFPFPSFPGLWLGSPFGMADSRFAVFYDDLLVFSNTEKGIREYLNSRIHGATLGSNNRFSRFAQHNSGRANISVFADINKIFSLNNDVFGAPLAKQIEEKEETIRRFGMISWQLQHSKGKYVNALAIDFQSDLSGDAQTTWQSEIGSNIIIKPIVVINHNDPGNREIIVQDNQNNLHLVSNSGRVRWSAPLSGQVMGEIKQIDFYKNGRLQYFFNTKEKLYLIDRNGNNVAHFPVTLKSPATNGVNVFDYHNNRDYRYFVAGEDKRIYAYDGDGKIVTGWNFGQTESTVFTPVQHFRVDGNDYIVFKDKSRIYIRNRQGETRVPVSARFDNSKNPLVLNLNGTPKIVATDTGGKVYYIYFEGKVEEKKTGRFSENHFFTVDDLDGNGVPDFVFVDGNEVTAMDENGKKLFSKKLDRPIKHQPNIYTFAPDLKKVGVVDPGSNRIYLFGHDGKLHQGFPLQGNTEFTIGKLSDGSTGLNLIVGSEGGKLYNYSLE